jgi:hypothetical protein
VMVCFMVGLMAGSRLRAAPAELRGAASIVEGQSRWHVCRRWFAVNAGSIFPICAEVKFPRQRVAVISRRRDRGLRLLAADRGDVAVVPGWVR